MSAESTTPRIRCAKCDTSFPAAMAVPPTAAAAAGWYPDPAGGNGQRYWDGSTWGPVAPGSPAPIPTPIRPSKPMPNAGKAILIVGTLVLAGGCVAYLATGPHSSSP
ncbi:DUF2510 domain-containing protein, partial [Mycolicibacterium gadium]